MGRRPKSEPAKKPREYWLEDINNRLARTSYAICKLAQIESETKLTDREIISLIDTLVKSLVASQKAAQLWIKEHK